MRGGRGAPAGDLLRKPHLVRDTRCILEAERERFAHAPRKLRPSVQLRILPSPRNAAALLPPRLLGNTRAVTPIMSSDYLAAAKRRPRQRALFKLIILRGVDKRMLFYRRRPRLPNHSHRGAPYLSVVDFSNPPRAITNPCDATPRRASVPVARTAGPTRPPDELPSRTVENLARYAQMAPQLLRGTAGRYATAGRKSRIRKIPRSGRSPSPPMALLLRNQLRGRPTFGA